MSVFQTLYVYEGERAAAWLENRRTEGTFRATAHAVGGDYAAVGVMTYDDELPEQSVRSARSSALTTTSDGAELPILPPPIAVPVLPLLGQVAHIPADRFIAFLFLKAAAGSIRTVAESIAQGGDDTLAVAYAFGSSDFNIVVEVVAPEQDELLERVLGFVDQPGIEAVRSLHTVGSLTRGFGDTSR
jgi:hypothetical protein